MENVEVLTLFELLQQVRNAVENGVSGAVWVRAEVSEIKRNPSGHCYLTLIEKSPSNGQVRARANAIIWSNVFRLVDPMFRRQTGSSIQAGMNILALARVQFTEQYGLSLIISDVDASFTLGDMEAVRRQTIARLEEEGMMEMNRSLPLPVLPRRFAVITSATAAGWRDFCNHLCGNEYGFAFHLEHFPAVMQGEDAPGSIISALDAISARSPEFDAVLIMRGGGSAMDMVCFDDYELAVNVAQFPLPILTGIGHDHDYHVIDMVAHTYVKTPTALADFILDIFAQEAYRIMSLTNRLKLAVNAAAARQNAVFDNMLVRMKSAVDLKFQKLNLLVDALRLRLKSAVSSRFSDRMQRLSELEGRIQACDPAAALERGCSFILRDGRKIISSSELKGGDVITIMLRDGTVKATIND